MPSFDSTGSRGGSRRGRGSGPCGGGRRRGAFNNGDCFRSQPPIMSFGGPPRWGYGPWGYGISVSGKKTGYPSQQMEIAALRDAAAYLEGELEAIKKRLAELEGS